MFCLVRPWNCLCHAVLRYYITITSSAVSESRYAPRGILTSQNTVNTCTGTKPLLHFTVRTGCSIDWEIRGKVKRGLVTAMLDAYGRKTSELSSLERMRKTNWTGWGRWQHWLLRFINQLFSYSTGKKFCSSPQRPDRLWRSNHPASTETYQGLSQTVNSPSTAQDKNEWSNRRNYGEGRGGARETSTPSNIFLYLRIVIVWLLSFKRGK